MSRMQLSYFTLIQFTNADSSMFWTKMPTGTLQNHSSLLADMELPIKLILCLKNLQAGDQYEITAYY